MRSMLTTTIALAALGFGALLAAAPAAASQTGGVSYMSARQLQQICKAQHGTYGLARPAYFCVLGTSAITCDPRLHRCTLAATQASSSDDDTALPDYPPPSLIDGLLVPDSPVRAPPSVMGPIERGHGPRVPH